MGRSVIGGSFPGRPGPGQWGNLTFRGLVLSAGLASVVCTASGPTGDDQGTAKLPKDLTTAPLPGNVSPFSVLGVLESFTLDDPTDVRTAAKMVVNGLTVVLPRNTLAVMPSGAFYTPQQLFTDAPAPYAPTQSGLALADMPKPFAPFEVALDGNRVGDQYIAGLVHVSHEFLNTSDAIINFIDYTRGEMWVGGPAGQMQGSRLQINDPTARFGRAMSPDARFSVDPDNPTVHAATGYPMCIPRTDPAVTPDPLCPQANRPVDPMTGVFLSNFTMDNRVPGHTTDQTQQAPFEVGDFITYAGTLAHDERGDYISAHTIEDNLGIFTAPGSSPSYLSLEADLVGTGGVPVPGVPQEATIRFKMEGFTTDPTTLVDIFMIDISPCSGAERERQVATVNPLAQPLFGRFRFIVDALNVSPLTREVRFRSRNGEVPNVANGIVAGQYRFPVDEFIFAERFVLGANNVPLNLQDFPFLAQGIGPLGGTGPIIGQLSPWPGVPTPPAAVCQGTNALPIANAGPDLTVITRRTVRLNGTRSFDPDFTPITFAWTQTAGPPVVLDAPTAASPTFTAPRLLRGDAPVTLTFALTVSDGLAQAVDTVDVVVNPAGDTVTITAATFSLRRSTLTVNATSDDPTHMAILNLLGFGVMTNNGDGTYTFAAIGQQNPGTVTVNSSLGGSDSASVTVIR
jgi:hypothetical protein